MPALNFKKQFVPDIESGKKCQTIRKPRKDGRNPETADQLYLYTGMRTKASRHIKTVICRSSYPITIYPDGSVVVKKPFMSHKMDIPENPTTMAKKDGFKTVDEFLQFFRDNHSLPFHGYLIKW